MDLIDCSKEIRLLFNEYDRLRGLSAKECAASFWDAVVFSVCDKAQREAFHEHIARFKQSATIPLVDYLAIEDVPQYKMGSGGATMHVLNELSSIWGQENLMSRKVLLIHTGGQSRRLPQHSALGKLFARLPLPLEKKHFKETGNSNASNPKGDLSSFNCSVGTMLDLKLAMYLPFCRKMTSGVFLTASDDIEIYAIDGNFKVNASGFTALAHPSPLEVARGHGVYVLPELAYPICINTPCLRVLQKPSMDEMNRQQAVLAESFAYTDSAFAFGADVVKALISYYQQHLPLNEEICAYRDFLTCLGKKAPKATKQLQQMLQKFELSIIVLPQSIFYHIGTLAEYLDHLCSDLLFKKQLGLDAGSSVRIHSSLPATGPQSAGRYILEFCDFSKVAKLVLGRDCVLYGCQGQAEELQIPDSVVMFTVAVKSREGLKSSDSGYVTLCFGINDDLKSSSKLFGRTDVGTCLWNANLFRVASTRSESLVTTLQDIKQPIVGGVNRYSMEDVLKHKCISEMLDFQATLVSHINMVQS
ncbi:fucose-1-phosphate guanylyltransferase-like [Varroa jacobsoni]|uniref:fucose-1-phosphate guanylyltransferase-like n=1 Tax=Varroa jacobsoni TaxID=62625 RepID=UPI000BF60C70|nr:fucose-1-phosphate guanylyltransferase-like [Varroa jacobsoni]XP_022705104.1 fucose-1-phosphate guanylyltransferase-like [Varroa jacobsoni]XP_022705105.1 fucose-1-phosphate guanylyltransferase-like [Varroa jacobsoni]